ncbi:hypothetical protein C6500_11905 [Candidatus Poribacteria bacterium]|nr:MAG: hypothetical protein C6500_11905 [Candidatus Poribacteria bacterium]
MAHTDAELIRRILRGDQDAFSPLVKKYQKGVHTLAWRKIGDFHIAQEITQDAFLTAYKKLRTLKNHNQFAGWLYVIAANLCRDYLKKNRLPMESLDADNTNEVDKVSYSRYVAEKQENEADETRREIVKELLKKLPESERTVIMMHYLGEMTIKAISEFLGVSQNTVKSRLSRARNRLRKEEDIIQENLGSFQLPDTLAENIMQEVSRLTPVPPAVSKPVAPLAVSAASAVLIFLLMGVGTQYLSRFQKPYSLDATSEPTVEIIDAVFVLDSPAKPAIRSQAGSSVTPGKAPGSGQQSDETLFATLPVDNTRVATPKPQWTQTKGPVGGSVQRLFVTANGNLYAGAGTDLYTLTDDGNAWRSITPNVPIQGSWQIIEHEDTLYIVSDTELLASGDGGKTWNSLGTRPEGQLIDLLITDEAPGAQADILMYLALANGVFRSTDVGKSWTSLNNGISDRKIRAITAIENTLFVGTDAGLYRHRSEGWEQLPVGESENVRALESAEHQLYVAVGPEVRAQEMSPTASMRMTMGTTLSLYRSTDLGDSWQALDFTVETEFSQENSFSFTIGGEVSDSGTGLILDTKIIASQENLLVLNGGKSYYSNDSGKTWVNLGSDISDIGYITATNTDIFTSDIGYISPMNTFYKSGPFGIYRTIDAGKTWHPFNTGLVKTGIMDLVATSNKLYANMGQTLVISPDGGESWTPVSGDTLDPLNFTAILEFNNTLYTRGVKEIPPQLFQLSDEDNTLIRVPGMPILEGKDYNELIGEKMKSDLLATVNEEMEKDLLATVQDEGQKNSEVDKKLNLEDVDVDKVSEEYSQIVEQSVAKLLEAFFGSFAVSDTAYYMEYEQRLFRWKPGTTQWFDTGLVNKVEFAQVFDDANDLFNVRLKLAVLGKTVYAGKSDGHLFQSFDEGDTWNDVTTSLPFSVTYFKTIAFAGSTIYIATDKGVASSNDGISWQAATDAEGMPLIIEKLAVDGTTVYGANQQRVYQLKANANTWQQVTPEVPVRITSLAVDGNTLYVGTAGSGVLRFTLDESE